MSRLRQAIQTSSGRPVKTAASGSMTNGAGACQQHSLPCSAVVLQIICVLMCLCFHRSTKYSAFESAVRQVSVTIPAQMFLLRCVDCLYCLRVRCKHGRNLPFPRNRFFCQEHTSCKQVTNKGRPVELKSVAINKARPHQMAIAAGDCYLRVYDRRMLSLTQPSGAPPPQPLLALAPPHLSSGEFEI